MALINMKFIESAVTGSAVYNGREPKSYLGRVFNSKLGRIAALLSKNAAATSRVENSAQGSSCQLKFVHGSSHNTGKQYFIMATSRRILFLQK